MCHHPERTEPLYPGQSSVRQRLNALLLRGAVLVGAGAAYAALIAVLGRGLYCPFWKLTGLKCPGCGVTRVCLALLRLDLAGAWRANAALLLSLPVLAALALRMMWVYVRTGRRMPSQGEERLIWGLVVYFLAWGVARNLPL